MMRPIYLGGGRSRSTTVMHEIGNFWVGEHGNYYAVYEDQPTRTITLTLYSKSDHGLSVAKACCDHFHRKMICGE